MNKALLVMGMQYDHLSNGPLPVDGADELLTPIRNYIVENYLEQGLVIAAREWHPKNHFSFSESWDGHDPYPIHCVEGTKGARIHTGIARYCDAIVSFGQHRNAEEYSAFSGKTLRPVVDLSDILHECDVTSIEVCGIRAGVEVAQTALDAHAIGYDTYCNLTLSDYLSMPDENRQVLLAKLERARVNYG